MNHHITNYNKHVSGRINQCNVELRRIRSWSRSLETQGESLMEKPRLITGGHRLIQKNNTMTSLLTFDKRHRNQSVTMPLMSLISYSDIRASMTWINIPSPANPHVPNPYAYLPYEIMQISILIHTEYDMPSSYYPLSNSLK